MTENLGAIRSRIATLSELGRHTEVAELARRGLTIAPDDAMLLAQLALALRKTDLKQALDAAGRAVAAAPDDEWPHRVAAWVQLEAKRPKKALPHAERAVALAPHLAAAHLTLATARSAAGDHRGAAAACNEAIRLAPAWSSVWVERSRQSIGAKDWQAAERWARKALELRADDPRALNNLAVAVERQGRRPEALDLYARAAALDPHDDTAAANARATARNLGALGIGTFTGAFLVHAARAIVIVGGAAGVVVALPFFAVAGVVRALRRRRELAALPPHLRAFAEQERRAGRTPVTPDNRRDRIVVIVLGVLILLVVLSVFLLPDDPAQPSPPTIDLSDFTIPPKEAP